MWAALFVGLFCLPNTPNSLIERGHLKEAMEQLVKIRDIPGVDEEFKDLVTANEGSKQVKHPWIAILDRKYTPQLTMAIDIPFFQQLTGMNMIMFYAPALFKTTGFGSNASLISHVITRCVNFLATILSILTVDKVGKRSLFLASGVHLSGIP
jgi:hypothetical protein